MEGGAGGEWKKAFIVIFGSTLRGFLPLPRVSLTEQCSLWYVWNDLFNVHKLADKFDIDRQNWWRHKRHKGRSYGRNRGIKSIPLVNNPQITNITQLDTQLNPMMVTSYHFNISNFTWKPFMFLSCITSFPWTLQAAQSEDGEEGEKIYYKGIYVPELHNFFRLNLAGSPKWRWRRWKNLLQRKILLSVQQPARN